MILCFWVKYKFFELFNISFKDKLTLFSVINLKTPRQARLNANGSFELLGFSSIPKKPTNVSILSAIATLIEIFSFGTFPLGPKGK